MRKTCVHCGKEYTGRKEKMYCNSSCYAQTRTVGNNPWRRVCAVCGSDFRAKPSNDKKYCSRECYFTTRLGENNTAWKGGITPKTILARNSVVYKNWRNAVFDRDNWTCQDCSKRGGELHAHHVFGFAEFEEHRFDVWNGITLCKSCHAIYHPNISVLWETLD